MYRGVLLSEFGFSFIEYTGKNSRRLWSQGSIATKDCWIQLDSNQGRETGTVHQLRAYSPYLSTTGKEEAIFMYRHETDVIDM